MTSYPREVGRAFEQSLEDYMAKLASTSSLSRTLGVRAGDLERQARAILARHGLTRVRADVVSAVIWGRPR